MVSELNLYLKTFFTDIEKFLVILKIKEEMRYFNNMLILVSKVSQH